MSRENSPCVALSSVKTSAAIVSIFLYKSREHLVELYIRVAYWPALTGARAGARWQNNV